VDSSKLRSGSKTEVSARQTDVCFALERTFCNAVGMSVSCPISDIDHGWRLSQRGS
jgi:hypothetical protein